jgi:hypothetical protein
MAFYVANSAMNIRALVVNRSLVNFSTSKPLRIATMSPPEIDIADERREFA